MQRGRLTALSEALVRVTALVDDLAAAPEAVRIADRPGFLLTQPQNDPQPIIERLASAKRLTFVVGAGASMEAGLPSWGNLVRSVLESVAPASLDESDRAAWLDAAAESGLLGMAATARALAGSDEDLVERVERHVYRGRGPEHFDPGALTREIAAWKRDFPEIQLATFNYDQLLERALEDLDLEVASPQRNPSAPRATRGSRRLEQALARRHARTRLAGTHGCGRLLRWPGHRRRAPKSR